MPLQKGGCICSTLHTPLSKGGQLSRGYNLWPGARQGLRQIPHMAHGISKFKAKRLVVPQTLTFLQRCQKHLGLPPREKPGPQLPHIQVREILSFASQFQHYKWGASCALMPVTWINGDVIANLPSDQCRYRNQMGRSSL